MTCNALDRIKVILVLFHKAKRYGNILEFGRALTASVIDARIYNVTYTFYHQVSKRNNSLESPQLASVSVTRALHLSETEAIPFTSVRGLEMPSLHTHLQTAIQAYRVIAKE